IRLNVERLMKRRSALKIRSPNTQPAEFGVVVVEHVVDSAIGHDARGKRAIFKIADVKCDERDAPIAERRVELAVGREAIDRRAGRDWRAAAGRVGDDVDAAVEKNAGIDNSVWRAREFSDAGGAEGVVAR